MKRTRFLKFISVFTTVNLLVQIFWPSTAHALTGGPSQPEVQSFEPVGTNEMVDAFSGDFVYNIPLMDVGGYPINISYHSGVNMDQEASWVGLGWNINPGVINRNVRGLPDDFDGDIIKKEMNLKPNKTTGVTAGIGMEIVGLKNDLSVGANLSMSLGIYYNNYKGWGYEFSIDPSISAGEKDKMSCNAGLGLSFNSQEGIGVTPSLGFSITDEEKRGQDQTLGFTIGAPYNSRTGLKELTFSTSFSEKIDNTDPTKNDDEIVKGSFSSNGGSTLSFGMKTYTPELSMPMINYNYSLRFTLGIESGGFNGNVFMNGYISGQKFIENTQYIPAYGYMNMQDARGQSKYLLDFNREKDGVYTDQTPNLPLTNLTYDIYGVEANGLGGCYRLHRSDIGYICDAGVANMSVSGSSGFEFGSADLLKLGLNIGVNFTQSHSGGWSTSNDLTDHMQFTGKDDYPDDHLFEPSYFKNAGEKSEIDEAFYASIHKDDAVAPVVSAGDAVTNFQAQGNNNPAVSGGAFSVNGTMNRKSTGVREKRNSPMTFLNAEDASYFGLDKNIVSYQRDGIYNDSGQLPIDSIYSRVNSYAKKNHLSEVTVLKPDGTRYVFGIPAYNLTQEEATFSVYSYDIHSVSSKGLIAYNPGDNTVNNSEGSDNYYNSIQTPAYAHSFLLTAVLSPDYVDVTGDGITDDDYGTAIKFNYNLTEKGYKWRVPYDSLAANHNEGFLTDLTDDKGNFIYGTKDLWYLSSIESKHYIAIFHTSYRSDGQASAGRDGGGYLSGQCMHALRKIDLYSRQDLKLHRGNAIPIKSVNFVYDYSLCPGVGNNLNVLMHSSLNTGKLTLKKIYFTYQNSPRGKLNSYTFKYNSYNPGYNLKGYDRWGNFKPNARPGECDSLYDPSMRLPNPEFPYVTQNKDSADKYAGAWALDSIGLPSGGTIAIKYESDDYAYVQNKRAMQMFTILGASSTPYFDPIYPDPYHYLYYDNTECYYLFFNLQKPLSKSQYTLQGGKKYIYNEYLDHGSLTQLYFKFLVDLKQNTSYEFVPGYADIDTSGCGVLDSDPYDYKIGYVKVKPASITKSDGVTVQYVNPIAKASWQFLRLNCPKLLYNEHPDGTTDNDLVQNAINFAMDLKEIFIGYERGCRSNSYGRQFVEKKSFVRLYNPEKQKFGGGTRVQQISISDNWNTMASGQPAAQYGQVYNYTTTEIQPDGSSRTISSGVASYEPILGGDENPWHQPVTYDNTNLLAPDNKHYQETPFGESFFPAASVGYSRITVANLPHTGVKRTATGYTVKEFYTTKDFPTILKQTDIQRVKKKSSPLNSLLKIGIVDYTTAAQGYCIELNDMNGKPRSSAVYAENKKDPISKVEYYYHRNKQNPQMLDNTVTVIRKDGTVTPSEVGVDFDMVNDLREQTTDEFGTNIGANLDFFVVGTVPIPLITFWPGSSNENTRFRSAVTTKVVQRYGILDSVVAYDNTSRITTENVAYDAETGEVLLTRTQNEWDDPVYTFNYPAHWGYTGMSCAYKNIGARFKNLLITNGQVMNLPHPELYFTPGDEIKVTKYTYNKYSYSSGVATRYVNYKNDPGVIADKIWVENVNGHIIFIDKGGRRVNYNPNNDNLTGEDDYTFEIIRSGYRNQQTGSIGSVTTLYNPLKNPAHLLLDSQVVNTTSTEYSEQWQTYCSKVPTIECDPITNQAKDFLKLLNALATTNKLAGYPSFGTSTTGLDSGISSHYDFYDASSLRRYIDSSILHPIHEDGCHSLGHSYERRPYFFCSGSPTDTISWILHGVLHIGGCSLDYAGCEFYISGVHSSSFSFNTIDSFNNLLPAGNSPGPDYVFFVNAYCGGHLFVLSGITCFKISDCHIACKVLDTSQIVNPYLYGLRGDWRPKKSHVYLQKRNADSSAAVTNIRKNGTLQSYHHFWINPGTGADWQPNAGDRRWVWNSEVTQYSPYGTEIEDKDPLHRYSSAIFDFHQSVPAAVANNARYRQTGSEGFEDYESFFFSPPWQQCEPVNHWKLDVPATFHMLDTTIAHTGKRSLRIPSDSFVHIYRDIDTSGHQKLADTSFFRIRKCDCIQQFAPDTGQKYVFTAWLTENTGALMDSFTEPYVLIKIYRTGGSPLVYTLRASGTMLENWQRIYGTFTVPKNSTGIDVYMYAGHSPTNFDDMRIHPVKANMKTYVYDPATLKLMAEMDENNYATIYEYDQEGALLRVKKETVKGVMTIKESRNGKTKAGL